MKLADVSGPQVHSIDQDGAATFLRRLGREIAHVEPAGRGEWSVAFGFVDDGHDLIVRFGRHRDDFEKDRVAASFRRPGLPVPAVHDIGPSDDGWYAISGRVWGTPLEELDEAGWTAVLPSMLSLLDGLRSLEPPSAAGSGPAGYGPWTADGTTAHPTWRAYLLAVDDIDLRERRPTWRNDLVAAGVGTTYDRGLERLAAVADVEPGGRHVVHADLVNRNVFVAGGVVTGVFDWGCSLVGDPLFDVAWLDLWSPWHPGLRSVGWRSAALAHLADGDVDLTDADPRIAACQLRSALAAMAYSVSVDRLDDVSAIAERVVPLLEGARLP